MQGSTGLPDTTLPIYEPPKSKLPRARVGGTTRGSLGKDPQVVALVPDHLAQTSREEPTLYWYISQTTSLPIIFTLREDEAVRPILEVPLSAPKKPGIQVLRLKDYNVKIKEEIIYRWFVSVQRDKESPSQDIVTGGMIERVPFLETIIFARREDDPLLIYAKAGFWYDALKAICDKIEAAPEDKLLRQQRACLLEQAGLSEIGQLDRADSPGGKKCSQR